MFQFPRDPEQRKIWATLCNVELFDDKERKVCSKHFKESEIGKKKLLSNAVPTLFLNHLIDKPDQVVSVSDILMVSNYSFT